MLSILVFEIKEGKNAQKIVNNNLSFLTLLSGRKTVSTLFIVIKPWLMLHNLVTFTNLHKFKIVENTFTRIHAKVIGPMLNNIFVSQIKRHLVTSIIKTRP